MTLILKIALENAICEEFLKSNKYITKETVQRRVLDSVKKLLHLKSVTIVGDPDRSIYVHPEISTHLINLLSPDDPALDEEERSLLREVYSADHHNPGTIRAFADLMEKTFQTADKKRRLYAVFAVDGLLDDPLAEYVGNLQFPMHASNNDGDESLAKHVKAVRDLYDEFPSMSVEVIALAVRNAMYFVQSSDTQLRKMTDHYLSQMVRKLDDIRQHFGILKKK